MNPRLSSLIRQVPPPAAPKATPPNAQAWHDVEAKLGLALPDDYKDIIETYGDYYWKEFLFVLNPFSNNENVNLLTRLEATLDAERQTRAEFPHYYPLPLYPEAGGLLPFLITDNGDVCFWITQAAPNDWPILIKGARPPEFEVRFVRTAALLFQFMIGRLQSSIIPSWDDDETA